MGRQVAISSVVWGCSAARPRSADWHRVAVTADPSPGLSGVLLYALRKARGHQSGAQNAVGYVNGAEIVDLAPELG